MKLRKIWIFFSFSIFFSLCFTPLFAAENNGADLTYALYPSMGTNLQYNAAPLPSAPSPALFSFGLGFDLGFYRTFAFRPDFQFSGTYYLLQDGSALPAAPESRTAYVISALFDMPVCYIVPVGKTQFYFGAGLALYIRAAFLASKVPSSEQESITAINQYFWSNARFLYPSFQLGWDFLLHEDSSFGINAKVFFPLGNAGNENAYSWFQDGIISVSARIKFTLASKNSHQSEQQAIPEENPQETEIQN
ncbi:MAG: hypothetical protein K6G52_07340 [Treponemataceae bacterium]|nr:hypothetical protein [Treponemataceae bacterium]